MTDSSVINFLIGFVGGSILVQIALIIWHKPLFRLMDKIIEFERTRFTFYRILIGALVLFVAFYFVLPLLVKLGR